MIDKKKVLLHDQMYSIGGPKVVLDGISNSFLKNKYEFVRLQQTDNCGFNPFKAIRFIFKYTKLINKEHADVIYICGLQYSGLLMTIASKLSNVKKIVLSVHGSDWDNQDGTFRKFLLMHFVEPLELCLSDSIITVCESAQRIIKPLKNKKNNDGVVYNTFPNVDYEDISSGLFRKEQNLDSDRIVVTSVGRIVKAKGHQYIIDAIKQIKDNRFVFVIVGDGDYLHVYKNECQKEITEGRVILLGKRTDVLNILKDSDIFLFATFNENHSIALLEAVSMKCCVLCTNIGGNPEIIRNNETGMLIPRMDSKAIVSGLYNLMDKNVRSNFAEKAFNECNVKFSIEKTYGKLDEIFSSK